MSKNIKNVGIGARFRGREHRWEYGPDEFFHGRYGIVNRVTRSSSLTAIETHQAHKPYRDPCGCNAIAWTKACSRTDRYRNGQEAVKYATVACELTESKNWEFLDTLAAAFAESMEF